MTARRSSLRNTALQFKVAGHSDEFEAIHRLNHRTFAEEIPQHDPVPDARLVDRFHPQNTYLIALDGRNLAGMAALRFDRPFSLDQKIPAAMRELPPDQRWCEIRLLAIEPAYRGSPLLAGLLQLLLRVLRERNCHAAVISATTRQMKLYRHLGFTPFGPLVGREGAWYQPMWITFRELGHAVPWLGREARPRPVNLLPGPVEWPPYVRKALMLPPVQHRSPSTLGRIREIQDGLTVLTGAPRVALCSGGGTLANDIIAAQLSLSGQPGAVLVSGEFGSRLADHAARAGLDFTVLALTPGTSLDAAQLDGFLAARPGIRWFWLTHCETGTGVLHPLHEMAAVCRRHDVRICADCVSSLGCVPVDLRGIWMASASSGKALAACAGVSLVFSSHKPPASPGRIPRALDAGLLHGPDGMPFTLSSNLIAALHAAVLRTDWEHKFTCIARHGLTLRSALLRRGFSLCGKETEVSPAVITLTFPAGTDTLGIAAEAEEAGFLVAARSTWLRERNCLQVCLMGDLQESDTLRLPQVLEESVRRADRRAEAGTLPADGDKGRPEIERLRFHGG